MYRAGTPRQRAAAMKTWQRSRQTPRLSAKASLALSTMSVISTSKTISRFSPSNKACACASASPVQAVRTLSREMANCLIGGGQARFAQKQVRRESLDRAIDHALRILCLDRAVDIDPQFGQRTCRAEYVGYIAERVLVRS